MRIATWNINSLKIRLERVQMWLAEVQPDVLCLQETKLADGAFPSLDFEVNGYQSAHFGQGQWNGVAIISKVGLDDVAANFAPGIEQDEEARIITAKCNGVRVSSVYVPNGRSLDHDHYQYKLSWMRRLREHVAPTITAGEPVVVCGDFNIAPTDDDVYDPSKFTDATHVSAAERAALADLCDAGLSDAFRAVHRAPKVFSWWDYRAGDFHQGRGMRIDLMLASAQLTPRWAIIDRNARKGQQPSDHAPIVADLEMTGSPS